jgi:hypothetical protein
LERERSSELQTRYAQSRVNRVQWDGKHVSDFDGRHLFDFVKDEHSAAADVDPFERRVDLAQRLSAGERFALRRIDSGPSGRVVTVRVFGVAPAMPASIARDAHNDLEQPRARPVPSVRELVEATVDNNEDLLGTVFGLRLVTFVARDDLSAQRRCPAAGPPKSRFVDGQAPLW